MIAAIAAGLQLLFLILGFIKEIRDEKKAEEKQYKIDHALMLEAIERATTSMRDKLAKKNKDVLSYNDMMNKRLKERRKKRIKKIK